MTSSCKFSAFFAQDNISYILTVSLCRSNSKQLPLNPCQGTGSVFIYTRNSHLLWKVIVQPKLPWIRFISSHHNICLDLPIAQAETPHRAWWRHQMETFSALLALCAGNSPVPVNSPRKGHWRGALMFSLICAWINDWVNNHEVGDLRRHRGHYDVHVMGRDSLIHYWYSHSQQARILSQSRYGLMTSFNTIRPVDTYVVINGVIVDSFTGLLYIRR